MKISFEQYMQDPTGVQRQAAELTRVARNVASVILDYCRDRVGCEFSLRDLALYVMHHANATPDSASRILRSLRQEGLVDYVVTSRSKSKYRIISTYE